MEDKKLKDNNEIMQNEQDEELESLRIEKAVSPAQLVAKRFFRNKLAICGVVILIIMFFFSYLGPLFMPYGEYDIFFTKKGVEIENPTKEEIQSGGIRVMIKAPLSKRHLLGTDRDGRDILVRLMYGGRISLLIGFVVVGITLILGVSLGGIAGYYGGFIDNLIMRLVDIFFCIPRLPIILILTSVILTLKVPQQLRIYFLMLVLGFLGWAGVARIVRGQILSLREQEFMVATEAVGLKPYKKIYKHLVPNVMPQLIVIATLGVGGTILTESALSYLGFGVPFPYASWGNMVNAVTDPLIMRQYLNIWMPPGLCILITVMGFNFVGDGLRDAFDPKMKR